MQKEELPEEIKSLADAWGSAWVARKEIDRFSGGLLHPRTMANLDSSGKGPPRFMVKGTVGYPMAGLLEWLAARFQTKRTAEGREKE